MHRNRCKLFASFEGRNSIWGIQLVLVRAKRSVVDGKTKEFNLRRCQLHFAWMKAQTSIPQALYNVLFKRAREDYYVIHVCHWHDVVVPCVSKHDVHKPLERGRRVTQAKRHKHKLFSGFDSYLDETGTVVMIHDKASVSKIFMTNSVKGYDNAPRTATAVRRR